jgi:hypothetical protein
MKRVGTALRAFAHPTLAFDLPGIIRNRTSSENFAHPVKFHFWSIFNDHDERIERLKRSGLSGVKLYREVKVAPFVRMLAKVAHAGAVARYGGLDSFTPLLPEAILKGTSAPYLIGCAERRTPPPSFELHKFNLEIREINSKRYVIAFLRLFANIGADVGTPVYLLVVGEALPKAEERIVFVP